MHSIPIEPGRRARMQEVYSAVRGSRAAQSGRETDGHPSSFPRPGARRRGPQGALERRSNCEVVVLFSSVGVE